MKPFRRWPPLMRNTMARIVCLAFILALLGCACSMLPELARYIFEGGALRVPLFR